MVASNNKRKKTASLSGLVSNSVLTVLKFIVGGITGSSSILSEAVHSSTDVLASIMSYVSIKASSKPADADHPWGHGKIEDVSSIIESVLILGAGSAILYGAVTRIINPHESPANIVGTLLMFGCAIVNLVLSLYVSSVAKSTESSALAADSLHLRTDAYAAGGVGVGLLVSALLSISAHTRWLTSYMDPMAALVVAIVMIVESKEVILAALSKLVDRSLPECEKLTIRTYLRQEHKHGVTCRLLRTRKSGSKRFIEIGMAVARDIEVEALMDAEYEISRYISKHVLPGSDVTVKLKLKDEQ